MRSGLLICYEIVSQREGGTLTMHNHVRIVQMTKSAVRQGTGARSATLTMRASMSVGNWLAHMLEKDYRLHVAAVVNP